MLKRVLITLAKESDNEESDNKKSGDEEIDSEELVDEKAYRQPDTKNMPDLESKEFAAQRNN